MTDYTALQAKWATLSPDTTANKLVTLNALTQAKAQPAILPVNKIINAIVAADLLALTTTQLQVLNLLFAGGAPVDASPGTTVRAVFQSIFVGKTTTLNNLTALVTPFDNATVPWWQFSGFTRPYDAGDVTAAGLS